MPNGPSLFGGAGWILLLFPEPQQKVGTAVTRPVAGSHWYVVVLRSHPVQDPVRERVRVDPHLAVRPRRSLYSSGRSPNPLATRLPLGLTT